MWPEPLLPKDPLFVSYANQYKKYHIHVAIKLFVCFIIVVKCNTGHKLSISWVYPTTMCVCHIGSRWTCVIPFALCHQNLLWLPAIMLQNMMPCHPACPSSYVILAFRCNGFLILFSHLNPWVNWHDDVIKRKHFPRYWPFVRGIHWSRWIPRTKASDAELWCFLWSMLE